MLGIVLVLTAAAIPACGGAPISRRVTPGAFPGANASYPLIQALPLPDSTDLRMPLAQYLAQAQPVPIDPASLLGDIQVQRAIQTGDVAFALAAITGSKGVFFAAFALEQGPGGWTVRQAASPRTWGRLPFPAGSNQTAFQALAISTAQSDRTALTGFVDPTVTRVEALTGTGLIAGVEEPTTGAVIVLTTGWGDVRVYQEGRLADVLPVVSAPRPPGRRSLGGRRGPAAQVSVAFVGALITAGWMEAAKYVAPAARADRFLPAFRQNLPAGIRVVGPPDQIEDGFRFPVSSADGPADLNVEMSYVDGSWRVWVPGYVARGR